MEISTLPLLERDAHGNFPRMQCHICKKALGNVICLNRCLEGIGDWQNNVSDTSRLVPTQRLNDKDTICGRATCINCDPTGGDLEKRNLCICHYKSVPGIDGGNIIPQERNKMPRVGDCGNFQDMLAQSDKEKGQRETLPIRDASPDQPHQPELNEWRKMFDEKLKKHFDNSRSNRQFLSQTEYQDIKSTLSNYDDFMASNKKRVSIVKSDIRLRRQIGGDEEESLKLETEIIDLGNHKSKMQRWFRKYELLPSGVMIYKRKESTSLQESITVSHMGRMFADIYDCHTKCGCHLAQTKTAEGVHAKFGASITRKIVSIFFNDCKKCMMTQTTKKAAAGLQPIVPKAFCERIQMDLIDMSAFKEGLKEVFQEHVKELKANGKKIEEWMSEIAIDKSLPQYILNIADHAAKVGKSYALQNKSAASVALCLLDWISIYGVPKIIHTDNGREFIRMVNDAKYKVKVLKHVELSVEEFQESLTLVS